MIPTWLAGLSVGSVALGSLAVVLTKGLWRSGGDWFEDFRTNLSDDPSDEHGPDL